MIKTFRNRETELLFRDERVPKLHAVESVTRRKLAMIHSARILSDLKAPPGNRLHALAADRKGQHAISINDQYRICFVWKDGDAYDVEITDYH